MTGGRAKKSSSPQNLWVWDKYVSFLKSVQVILTGSQGWAHHEDITLLVNLTVFLCCSLFIHPSGRMYVQRPILHIWEHIKIVRQTLFRRALIIYNKHKDVTFYYGGRIKLVYIMCLPNLLIRCLKRIEKVSYKQKVKPNNAQRVKYRGSVALWQHGIQGSVPCRDWSMEGKRKWKSIKDPISQSWDSPI